MMLFDPQAALAEIRKQTPPPATLATRATQHGQTMPHVANVADVAGSLRQTAKNEAVHLQDVGNQPCHGFTAGGRVKTWTGNIVPIDHWRQLSEWDRYGPNGWHWCGVQKGWIAGQRPTMKPSFCFIKSKDKKHEPSLRPGVPRG